MLVEFGTRVDIGSVDTLEQEFGHSGTLSVHKVRLEEALRCPKPFASNLDLAPIRKFIFFHLSQT